MKFQVKKLNRYEVKDDLNPNNNESYTKKII